MKLIRIGAEDTDRVAPLIALFRAELNALRGIVSRPDVQAGKEEACGFLRAGFPVYAAEENGSLLGYMACRIDEPCVWVEHLFVREECRRKGAASMLFGKAEELAASMGEDTVYNFVHPNNEAMILFLKSKGYTVLNMLEIRKPFRGEKPAKSVRVDDNLFDY